MIYTIEQIKLIKTELRPINAEKLFEDYLNEVEPEIMIICMTYGAGTVLKEVDPIAFRCECANYIDQLVSDEMLTDEIDGEHYMLLEVEELFKTED